MTTRQRPTRTRAQNQNVLVAQKQKTVAQKRPLEDAQEGTQKKKCIFGDITNVTNNANVPAKRGVKNEVVKKAKTKSVAAVTKTKKSTKQAKSAKSDDLPSSQNSVKSEESSLDSFDLSLDISSSQGSNSSVSDRCEPSETSLILSVEAKEQLKENSVPIDDIDKENLSDPYQVALYARFIFNYYKQRESKFTILDYLPKQPDLSVQMRAILVDWLVEVQENFELNHETLYLAIKLVDLYLSQKETSKENLQLVGATALFIACKFDERCPPMLDDFLYICDDAYQRNELLEMERQVLKTINFDLGVPLSYRYLRRYSKCARAQLITLTLARYILETSQMEYKFIRLSDSLRAAACLLLAMRMDKSGIWTPTMVHYSGHTEKELLPVMKDLNNMLSAAPSSKLQTIRVKYSHRVFHEVAKVPALDILEFSPNSSD